MTSDGKAPVGKDTLKQRLGLLIWEEAFVLKTSGHHAADDINKNKIITTITITSTLHCY